MDIKQKEAYGKVMIGNELILLNDGMSLLRLLTVAIPLELVKHTKRFKGPIKIELDFMPFNPDSSGILEGLDMSLVEDESEASGLNWSTSPMNLNSDSYDAIYHEYIKCMVASYRESKGPEHLALVKRHMERNYQNSPWWSGTHTF